MHVASSPAATRIGVLTGGHSRERDRSLQTGDAVAQALRALGHPVELIDTAQERFIDLVRGVEIAFLAIAGRYAEDGRLQGFLSTIGVPYTGSGVLASALAMHKPTAKTVVAAAGVPVLPHVQVDPVRDAYAEAVELLKRLDPPVIVKPESEGSSIDIDIANDTGTLADLIGVRRRDDLRLFAEPFVPGRIFTVGVLGLDRGLTAMPVVEVTAEGEFYDHTSKTDPARHAYHCPADLSPELTERIGGYARAAHRALGCADYSRHDFVLGEAGEFCWLEANTLPGLRRDGTFALMARVAGMTYEQLIAQILDNARRPRPYTP